MRNRGRRPRQPNSQPSEPRPRRVPRSQNPRLHAKYWLHGSNSQQFVNSDIHFTHAPAAHQRHHVLAEKIMLRRLRPFKIALLLTIALLTLIGHHNADLRPFAAIVGVFCAAAVLWHTRETFKLNTRRLGECLK